MKIQYPSEFKGWETETWKEKRKELLKDACQQCGTKEKPLQLHHTHKYIPTDPWARWRYENLLDKGIITLCKKCHEMLHNGFDLCPSCKADGIITYKPVGYPLCSDCISKTRPT